MAILGILASLLLPSLGKARDKSKRALCVSNKKQIMTALVMYSDDNSGHMPVNYSDGVGTNIGWGDHAMGYLNFNLTETQIKNRSPGIPAGEDQLTAYKAFMCPNFKLTGELEENLALTSYGPTRYSYKDSDPTTIKAQHRGWIPNKEDGSDSGRKLSAISGGSIAMGEGKEKVLGTATDANVDISDYQGNQNDLDFWVHDNFKLNWALIDGAVIYQSFMATLSPQYDAWTTTDTRGSVWDGWQ